MNYLYFPVQLYNGGNLRDVHVLAIPIEVREIALALHDLFVSVLHVLCLDWKRKIIGSAGDGELTMTGHMSSIGMIFRKTGNSEMF